MNNFSIHQISFESNDLRTQAHRVDGPTHNFDLTSPLLCVVPSAIQDAIKVFILNVIRIDKDQPPHAIPS
ncbi:hypothetical protein D3C76_1672700 [compost metagenome]